MAEHHIKVMNPDIQFGWMERTYLPEIWRGLSITTAHFARNLLQWIKGQRGAVTIFFPEERLVHGPRYRGRHALAKREDGTPKCVACFMCSTSCPANCIHIVAEEHPDPKIEKRPARFDIDYSRCVFCGFCEEACPCEAIYLTSDYSDLPSHDFRQLVVDKEFLLNMDQSLVEKKRPVITGRR